MIRTLFILIGGILVGLFLFKFLKRPLRIIKSYRRLGKKEFIKRLKKGFDEITPAERAKGELKGMVISLIGLLLGIVVVAIFRVAGFWFWIEISLIGGFIITIWQLIGKIQQYRVLKMQDKIMEELNMGKKKNGIK